MLADQEVHIVCEVCDTKTPIADVPEYIVRKLKSLLESKRNIDTGNEKSDHKET
jgi:hypothetical protein